MLHDTYLHERLARAAGAPSKREIATQLALAELRLRPSLPRRAARRGGRLLIRVGAWLMAYGTGRADPTAPEQAEPHLHAAIYHMQSR